MKEFVLIQDNDGHWYVLPADKIFDFYEWEDSKNYEDGVISRWATRVGGSPLLVKFTNWRIE